MSVDRGSEERENPKFRVWEEEGKEEEREAREERGS